MICIIFFVALIILSVWISSPTFKGRMGENAVIKTLSVLPESEYKLLNNVMIRTQYGTSQIDHVLVSIYGIFVIETKNYQGWITGSENSDYWTKNMYGKKYSFRNPIRQNYGHVKALMNVLNIQDEICFIPIIAFSSRADLKVKTYKNLIYIRQLPLLINRYSKVLFTIIEVQEIVEKILNANVDSKENRQEHVKQIHSKVRATNEKLANNICPKCGGQLIIRIGKFGSFKGCSNYPKCRYTYNLK